MNAIGGGGVYDRLKTEMLQVEKIELVSVKAENLENEPVPVKQEERDKDTPDLPSLPEIEKDSEIETGELSNSQSDKKSSPEKKKARKEQETSSSETKEDDFFDVLFVKADKSEISKEAIIDAEIQRYKAEPTIPMNQDSLEWWQNQRFLYPFLASVVLMYLQIPATSVPSERVFSTAGNILNKKRGALSASNADMLIFLHHNIKRKQQQQSK